MARRLALIGVQSHAVSGTPDLLWTGYLPQPLTADSLTKQLKMIYDRPPQWVSGSDKSIQFIAFCTGAAQDLITHARLLGVDAYLSGEISERTYYQAKELGLHYFACGHHATERDGIHALGEHLSTQFGVAHVFIDSDN